MIYSFLKLPFDEISISPLSTQLAVNLISGKKLSIITEFILAHNSLSWALWIAVLFIECISVFVLFFSKNLARMFGIIICLLHIQTNLIMEIAYAPAALAAILILTLVPNKN